MIPAGYLFKRVAKNPDWIKSEKVVDIYSVSGCISEDFADYVSYWKHNGYWLFNSSEMMEQLAQEHRLDLTGTTLFYYEVYEHEFDDQAKTWVNFAPETSFATEVKIPTEKHLQGFDVVNFYARSSPECSPLSCNGLASELSVNSHCLFTTLEEAKTALEQGAFEHSEPGPYRLFAVYTLKSV